MERVRHSLYALILLGLFIAPLVPADTSREQHETQLPHKLIELASEGQISDELISEFYRYSQTKAKVRIKAPDEFWEWLSKNREIERSLLIGLHPEYNQHVVTQLQELRNRFGSKVEQYPHLALAFSFVYGAAKGETIRAPWMSWVAKNRPVPSCIESFAYYINNKDKMLYSLDQVPWSLMLYVADNDLPLSEREWVLSRYKGRSLASLKRIHSDPDYIRGAAAKKVAKFDGAPMAIPRIMSDGGVCSQQAYYANRVFKCLGVPSVRLLERKHAYEGWVVDKNGLKVNVGAPIGRRDGYFLCPLTRTKKRQYQFSMLASAMDHSYEKYLKALVANHIFNAMGNDLKKESVGLLINAIDCNRYCDDLWLSLGQVCADGTVSVEKGWEYYQRAKLLVSERPEVACVILESITGRLIRTSLLDSPEQHRMNMGRIRAGAIWLKGKNRSILSDKIMDVYKEYAVISKGKLGAVNEQVATIKTAQPGCFAWRVVPDISSSTCLKVSIQHASAGVKGSFHIAAWADSDLDGTPDKQISISPLLEVNRKDQWSSWEFSSNYKNVFVGIARKEEVPFYYQMGGELEGYCGLSKRVYFSRKFGEVPQRFTQPRFANIRLEVVGN